MEWIDLAQDRWQALANAVMNFRIPYNAGNFLTNRGPVSFSGRILLHGVSIALCSFARLKAVVTVSITASLFSHVTPCTLISIYQRLQLSD